MKKKISLKWKIAEYLMLFAAGLIALLIVFQLWLLEPMYEKYKIESVRNASQQIEEALDDDDSNLTEVIYEISAANDTCVRIFEGSTDMTTGNMGCVLYRMSPRELLEQIELARENDNEYLSQTVSGVGPAGGPEKREDEPDMMKNLTFTKILESDDGIDTVIMVYSGLTPVNATLSTLRVQILYISLIVLIAVILLTYVMYRTVARPLSRINDAAKLLPEGSYSNSDIKAGYSEADELNETLQQAARDISKADKAKRDLIANVSHDLRTPLTMISGYGEMMRDLPGEKTDENIQVIIDESRRLTYLVNDLLDLSKMEEKKISLDLSEFSIVSLIEAELRKYDVYRMQDGFEITLDADRELYVKADMKRIAQVFNNLMTNAVNYSGESRKIDVRAKKRGDKVRVEVQDYGEGIPEDKLNDIWDRYYKVDKEHVRSTNSSGIGLSIVRQILEMHHAQFGVISQLNKGSTFWFELPLSEHK